MPSRSRRIWLSRACSSLTSFMAASRLRAGAPTLSIAMERLRFSSSNLRSMGTNIRSWTTCSQMGPIRESIGSGDEPSPSHDGVPVQ